MISVCMATYNGGSFIERQLRSILLQLSEEDELIISDDGSTDNTLDIVQNFNDSRIKVLHNSRHGVLNNFENAIRNASGDYIFLSDQDDEWFSNKTEVCLNYLKDYHCVISDCYIRNGDGYLLEDSFYKHNNTHFGRWHNLLLNNGYLGCCMAFRRQILDKILPFPKDIPMHDIWIGNVAAFKYSAYFIPEKLIMYRRHGKNASTASEKSKSSVSDKITYRWNIIRNLF